MANVKRYAQRHSVLNDLRHRGPALQFAMNERHSLEAWDPASLEGTETYWEKEADFKEIAGLLGYMENRYPGGLGAIAQDRFVLEYNLFGDVERSAVLGENTNGIDITMEWSDDDKLEGKVDLYNGKYDPIILNMSAKSYVDNEGRDRKEISPATGWPVNMTRELVASQVAILQQLMKTINAGQSKFTRIVKGWMAYVDLLRHGARRMDISRTNAIEYEPNAVLRMFTEESNAYIFCSDPTQHTYVAALHIMAQEYPREELPSDSPVIVPADGKNVVLVCDGDTPPQQIHAVMTPTLMLSAILRYAGESRCTDLLESALITACSIIENRYLHHIGLPMVESTVDLLIKVMTPMVISTASRPMINASLSKSLGRVHQMQMLLMIKDSLISAESSTRTGFSWSGTMQQYISEQYLRMGIAGTYMCDLKLVEATPRLHWLQEMMKEDIDDLTSVSIFEALWMATRCQRGVHDGGLIQLKQGYADMEDDSPYTDLLVEELMLAGVDFDQTLLPRGAFTVSGRSIVVDRRGGVRKKFFKTFVGEYIISDTSRVNKPRRRPLRRTRGRRRSESPVSDVAVTSGSVTPEPVERPKRHIPTKRPQSPKPAPTELSSDSSSESEDDRPSRPSAWDDSPAPVRQPIVESPRSSSTGKTKSHKPTATRKRVTIEGVAKLTASIEKNPLLKRGVGFESKYKDKRDKELMELFVHSGIIAPECDNNRLATYRQGMMRTDEIGDILFKEEYQPEDVAELSQLVRDVRLTNLHTRRKTEGACNLLEQIALEGQNFKGDITTIPREAFRYIEKSQAWKDFVNARVEKVVRKSREDGGEYEVDKAGIYSAWCSAGLKATAIPRVDALLKAYFNDEVSINLTNLNEKYWSMVETKAVVDRPFYRRDSFSTRKYKAHFGGILSIALALQLDTAVISDGLFHGLCRDFELSQSELRDKARDDCVYGDGRPSTPSRRHNIRRLSKMVPGSSRK